MEFDHCIRGNIPQLSNNFLKNLSLNLENQTIQRSILIQPLHDNPLTNHTDTNCKDHILNVPNNLISATVAMDGPPTVAISANTAHGHKVLWTPDEDKKLIGSVKQYGPKNWSHISNSTKEKLGKKCHERWLNHLRPKIMEPWTIEEDMILIKSHKVFGNKSTQTAKTLLSRTKNSMKNHWNATKPCQRIGKMKNKNPKITNDGSLLHAYIKEVKKFDEVENELTEKISEMTLDRSFSSKDSIDHGEGERTISANAINGEDIECGAIVEEMMEMDFVE